MDYFDGWPDVSVSPKQLGTAKTVNEIIKLLAENVIDYTNNDENKIFEKSCPKKSDVYEGTFDAYDFIKLIKENIKQTEDIQSVTFELREYNDMHFFRKYTYNCETGEYTGIELGTPEAAEEYIGDYIDQSIFSFRDLKECTIIQREDLYKEANPDDIYEARGCIVI